VELLGRNRCFRRLKWRGSLYRPAWPTGSSRGHVPMPSVPMPSGPAIGASPSGKAGDFDSPMRRFESSRPSQIPRKLLNTLQNRPGWGADAQRCDSSLIHRLCRVQRNPSLSQKSPVLLAQTSSASAQELVSQATSVPELEDCGSDFCTASGGSPRCPSSPTVYARYSGISGPHRACVMSFSFAPCTASAITVRGKRFAKSLCGQRGHRP
jgi:hypothetical protein